MLRICSCSGACLTHSVVLQEAQAAQQQTNGYNLTKTISFKVTMFDDFDRFGKVPDEYEKPERQPYKPQVGPLLQQLC